jgi:hypothetical protein
MEYERYLGTNLWIIGIEEQEIQTKGIDNLFKRTIVENFPKLEKESPNARHLQNTKPALPKKKQPQTHHNQNTQHIKQRKNSESDKREKISQIQSQTHKNNSRFLNSNYKFKKVMERQNSGPERKQQST